MISFNFIEHFNYPGYFCSLHLKKCVAYHKISLAIILCKIQNAAVKCDLLLLKFFIKKLIFLPTYFFRFDVIHCFKSTFSTLQSGDMFIKVIIHKLFFYNGNSLITSQKTFVFIFITF